MKKNDSCKKPTRVLIRKDVLDRADKVISEEEMSFPEALRSAIRYAYSRKEQLADELERQKLTEGQMLLDYNGDNKKLFSAMYDGDLNQLCCNAVFYLYDCRIRLEKGCPDVEYKDGRLLIRFAAADVNKPDVSDRSLCRRAGGSAIFDSTNVAGVTVVSELSNKRSPELPARLSSLARHEYLEIVMG